MSVSGEVLPVPVTVPVRVTVQVTTGIQFISTAMTNDYSAGIDRLCDCVVVISEQWHRGKSLGSSRAGRRAVIPSSGPTTCLLQNWCNWLQMHGYYLALQTASWGINSIAYMLPFTMMDHLIYMADITLRCLLRSLDSGPRRFHFGAI